MYHIFLFTDIEDHSIRPTGSKIVLTQAALKSLLGGDWRKAATIGGEWDASCEKKERCSWLRADDEVDAEDREAAIKRCLRQDSDDEEEIFSNCGFDGGDIDDEDGEDDEVSDEFKSLLESVTQKLLQRSQQRQNFDHSQESQQVQSHLQPKPSAKEKNVYITDNFDTPSQPDNVNEPNVSSSDSSRVPKVIDHLSVSDCHVAKTIEDEAIIKWDSADKNLSEVLDDSSIGKCLHTDDESDLKDKTNKNTSESLYSSIIAEKEQENSSIKKPLDLLTTQCSGTEDKGKGDSF